MTVPLEITFAGMPGLNAIRSKSLYGLSDLKMSWNYGRHYTYEAGRQEVINRLATISQPLPANVTPQISPESPTGEIYRYVLNSPKDASGHEIYTLNDLKALQDWVLEREFRTVPRIVDVCGWGGTVKRYEVQPDPDLLRKFGLTLTQLQNAISNSNATVGGDYVEPGRSRDDCPQRRPVRRRHRSDGQSARPEERDAGVVHPAGRRTASDAGHPLAGRSLRSTTSRSAWKTSWKGAARRPANWRQRASSSAIRLAWAGSAIGGPTRTARRARRRACAQIGHDEPDVVECIVLMRKNEQTLPALKDVKAKVAELNDPNARANAAGRQDRNLLQPHASCLPITTETVRENLLVGMAPRDGHPADVFEQRPQCTDRCDQRSAGTLLRIFRPLHAGHVGQPAVDRGRRFRHHRRLLGDHGRKHLSPSQLGRIPRAPLSERILKATHEVERALFFTTAIMVCAFVPLFTMQGPEGQIFGPMADTYAFALGGALFLALTMAPVMCLLLLQEPQPTPDNWLVRRHEGRLPAESAVLPAAPLG